MFAFIKLFSINISVHFSVFSIISHKFYEFDVLMPLKLGIGYRISNFFQTLE